MVAAGRESQMPLYPPPMVASSRRVGAGPIRSSPPAPASAVGALLVASLVCGCRPPPINGAVIVPQTREAQECAHRCEERHRDCLETCRLDASFVQDPAARPVCDGHCDNERKRCDLSCPGATVGRAAP